MPRSPIPICSGPKPAGFFTYYERRKAYTWLPPYTSSLRSIRNYMRPVGEQVPAVVGWVSGRMVTIWFPDSSTGVPRWLTRAIEECIDPDFTF